MIVLWHNHQPVGICIFATAAASLTLRSRYFGLTHPRTGLALSAMNRQLWLLQRVVLHPTYRGAGIGSAFVRRACELCPVDWIETLSAMGQANPLFEKAGFVKVGVIRKPVRGRRTRSGSTSAYASRRHRLTAESAAKSEHSEPVYYIFDNRGSVGRTPRS